MSYSVLLVKVTGKGCRHRLWVFDVDRLSDLINKSVGQEGLGGSI